MINMEPRTHTCVIYLPTHRIGSPFLSTFPILGCLAHRGLTLTLSLHGMGKELSMELEFRKLALHVP